MSLESGNHLLDRAASATDHATERAFGAAQRSVAALRGTSQQVIDRAQRASNATQAYIRDEPLKAVLIAAGAGAALMGLLGLLVRPRATPPQ